MKIPQTLPLWSIAAPVIGWLLLAGVAAGLGGAYELILVPALMASVLAAVYHAEVVAHRVGEPFGTLVLALLPFPPAQVGSSRRARGSASTAYRARASRAWRSSIRTTS